MFSLVVVLSAISTSCVQGYTNQGTFTNQYSSAYSKGYNSGYVPNYNQGYIGSYSGGYGATSNSGYGPNYNGGYGTNYNSGYGSNYNTGYGSNMNYGNNYQAGYRNNYGTGYTKNYGTGYGSGYADNFYNTFPYFFLDPFGVGYNSYGFQNQYTTGFPWSPFGQNPWSFGQFFGYYPFGHNMYGIHPHLHYNGHYGVYRNYGYGNKFVNGFKYQAHPIPVPVPGWGHPGQFFVHRRPSLGERIMNSPLCKYMYTNSLHF